MVEREVKELSQSDHDSVDRDFEQRFLQSELIFSTRVTLQDILNKKGRDSVGLLHMPFNFQVRDMGDSVLHIASFSENQASFGGERLIEALRGAKPVRAGMFEKRQEKDGIVTDWRMLNEDERKEHYPSYDPYDRLHRIHTDPVFPLTRKLGEHFREIGENHFSRFWDAIHVDFKDNVGDLEDTFQNLMSGEEALDMCTFDFIVSAYYIFPEAIREDQKFALAEFLKRKGLDIDITLDSDDLFRKTCSLVNGLTNPERKNLLTDFHSGLSDIEKRKFIFTAIADYSRHILVDEEGNFYGDKFSDFSEIKKIDRNQIEVRSGESYLRVGFVRDEKTGFREPSQVERNIQPEKGEIAPVIIWEKDKATGRRKYFCGKISEELIKAFPDMFFERQDALFGQIVVSAYSDYLKHKLPTELPLVKGGIKQSMMEAQMLAYVKLFAAAYLKISPVILGLERLAPKR